MAVRIGVSLASRFEGVDGRQAACWMVEQARAAFTAGLDHLTVGDHHSTAPALFMQNVPIMGRLLAEWHGRPAGCMFLVPLWPPVLMAEQIGTLSSLLDAPMIIQTGLGHGAQVRAMGVDAEQLGTRIEAAVPLVKRLLAGEIVDDGLAGLVSASVAPVPGDDAEWWMGGAAPGALDRAARLGDCWYANADLTEHRARELLARYLDACGRYGRPPKRIAIRKDVHVDDSAKDAQLVGNRLVAAGYRGFERGAVVYGDPVLVAEQLAPFAEMGFTDVVIRTMSVPQDSAVRTLSLAGEVRRLLGAA